MLDDVQIIKEGNIPKFVVIDFKTFKKIERILQDLKDVREIEKIIADESDPWEEYDSFREKILGNRIRRKREELGISQHELANRLKVSQAYISKLEKDEYNPSKKTLAKLAKVLNCAIQEIL